MTEWTKMRNTLPANPKVIGMAQSLGSKRKLLSPLMTGFGGAMLEVVTLDVMVSVVVCGLLRVWGTANEVARDGVLKGVTLEGLDAIAHVPGFGHAMAEVGWARESRQPRGVELPNFTEFNVPVDSRAAERQRRYRERRKNQLKVPNEPEPANPSGLGDVTRNVTRDVTRHDRLDKSRLEKEKRVHDPPARTPERDFVREALVAAEVPDFVEFWAAYPPCPNKHHRAAAERAWYAIAEPDRKAVIAGIKAYAKAVGQWPVPEQKYVPRPDTWLLDETWRADPAHWQRRDGAKVQPEYRGDDDRY